mmetsp:Transcript_21997/g.40156  ORF Transcript_21997/g.40156 Transcript_21997/m.40156 type:complete len:150 (-) Transcript_21997:26-475(-)
MEEGHIGERHRVTFSSELVDELLITPSQEDPAPIVITGSTEAVPTLLPSTIELATEIFNEIDVDHNRSINLKETITWWHANYAKLNAAAMFESVDQDRDGSITLEEWIGFWQTVRSHSHLDAEIIEELNNIRQGSSWVVFQDMPSISRD